ncbi:MAG: class beta-lactamase-related serine hydrolase [Microbacterium sp.]|jgi:CubicO group peptidase (beta-lactamase class C family)|nr:class beta-lactamase-related serine hydrolase [Microbacterium sp.]
MAPAPIVSAHVTPGFERVVEEFAEQLDSPARTGAALSIWHDGDEVVSAWGGTADHRDGRPWGEDTLEVIFSASKGLSALVLVRLHARGDVDLERPIRDVWPAFAAHGKGGLSIADVLAHRAGVSAPVDDVSLDEALDSRALAERIAAQKPLWEPGTAHAYHALTFGTIVQELVRRIDGRELHEVFADDIAGPLDADVSLMCAPEDLGRVARIVATPEWTGARTMVSEHADSWIARALTLGGAFPRALVDGDEGFNDPRVIAAGVAGAGGVGTASGLARIWSAVTTETRGVRLLDDEHGRWLSRVRSEGPWFFDPGPPYHRFGAGVQVSSAVDPWLSAASFGHAGAGGQIGIADLTLRAGVGYVTNEMRVTDRTVSTLAAFRAALGPR